MFLARSLGRSLATLAAGASRFRSIRNGSALTLAFVVVVNVALIILNAIELVPVDLGLWEQLLTLASAHEISSTSDFSPTTRWLVVWLLGVILLARWLPDGVRIMLLLSWSCGYFTTRWLVVRLLLVSELVDDPVLGLLRLVLGPVPCTLPPALLRWLGRWIWFRFDTRGLDAIWVGAVGDRGTLTLAFLPVLDVALVFCDALELILVHLGLGEKLLALAGAHQVCGAGHCAFTTRWLVVWLIVWLRRLGRSRRSRRWLAILSI